jgi:hypothetical protein
MLPDHTIAYTWKQCNPHTPTLISSWWLASRHSLPEKLREPRPEANYFAQNDAKDQGHRVIYCHPCQNCSDIRDCGTNLKEFYESDIRCSKDDQSREKLPVRYFLVVLPIIRLERRLVFGLLLGIKIPFIGSGPAGHIQIILQQAFYGDAKQVELAHSLLSVTRQNRRHFSLSIHG